MSVKGVPGFNELNNDKMYVKNEVATLISP